MNPQAQQPQPQSGERPGQSPDAKVGGEKLAPPAAGAAEQPKPGAAAPQNSGQPAATPTAAQLTAKDVAEAIASMPSGAAPVLPSNMAPPPVAADQDVIEPEWVDQAEQVIDHTAGDPYAEEEGVEALQIDYLDKRYGHKVKKPDQDKAA